MATLLVGTGEGLSELAGGTRTTHLAGHAVNALTAAAAGGPWSAIVDGGEVWESGAGDHDWSLRAKTAGPVLTCLAATPHGVLVGTAEAHLARLVDGHLEAVEGFEHVEGREEWYTPWGGPPDTRSLSTDGEATVFVNVHVGGIVTSADSGRRWEATSLDIHADVHQVLAGFAPGLVLAPCAQGLAVSEDAGRTWRIDDEGLHATYCRAVAVAGDVVVVSASTGPGGHHSALYRRPLGGRGPFERCRPGLPEWFDGNIDTGCLVASGDTVACATPAGEILVSTDGARTWDQAAAGLAPVHCLALAAP